MKRKTARFLQIAIPLGLGIFLTWYVYNRFTPEQLVEVEYYFADADYTMVILAVALSILSHVIRAYRWNFLLEPLGFKPSLANNFMAVSVAYLMNIFIPKSGEVSRAVVLQKYEKVPFDKGFGTIISERVIDLLFLMGFTALAFSLKFEELQSYLDENGLIDKAILVLIILAVASVTGFLTLKYIKGGFLGKLLDFLSGLKDGLLSILKMKKKWNFVVQSCVIWSLYLLSFYVSTKALDITASISWSTLVVTFVVGSFTFAFTNSGFGTYPAVVAGILFLFGVPETVGTAFGWIVWTANIASLVLFGLLSLLFLPIYNREQPEG